MTQQLRSVDAASCAKVLAILYGILGLLIGTMISLFFFLATVIGRSSPIPNEVGGRALGLVFGVGSIIFFPIFYAVIGAVGGLIVASLYNVVARRVGGIELEIG
jgi:hypothetical protein